MNGSVIAIGVGVLASLGAWCVARERLGAPAELPAPEATVAPEGFVELEWIVAPEGFAAPEPLVLAPLEAALVPAHEPAHAATALLELAEPFPDLAPGSVFHPSDVDVRMFSRAAPGGWAPPPAEGTPEP